MNTPLITDEKDPKWVLLGKILGIVSSRRVRQEMAKQGISPMGISELQKREELRRFAKTGRDSGSEGYLPILEQIQ